MHDASEIMNVALPRTKVESQLTEQFERVADDLPGNQATAEVRKTAIGTFASLGFPHRRIEEWKYTDLRSVLKEAGSAGVSSGSKVEPRSLNAALGPLAEVDAYRIVFVDDHYRAELSSSSEMPGVKFRTLANALAAGEYDAGDVLERAGPSATSVLALNAAFMTDGAIIDVAEGTELAKPLMIIQLRADTNARWTSLRSRIRCGRHARATLVEVAVSLDGAAPGQSNNVTGVEVGEGGRVTHVIAGMQREASMVANTVASIGEAAHYRPFYFTAGPRLTRNQLAVRFDGEDAKLDCSGAFLGRGSSHTDNTLTIDHASPGCESRELFKGVLDDQARGVFQGKVIVQQIAQKTDGKQMAQALMLSEDAEFDSKPELEIYADDVACGHGSTCAQLDPDHLFYLRARGIPEPEARALLVEAFVTEAIDKIEFEPVRDAIFNIAQAWLRNSAGTNASS